MSLPAITTLLQCVIMAHVYSQVAQTLQPAISIHFRDVMMVLAYFQGAWI